MDEEKKKSNRGKKKKTTSSRKETKKVVNEELNKKEETKVLEEKNIEAINDDTKKNKDGYKLSEVIILMVVTLIVGLFFGSYFTYKKYTNDNIDCSDIDKDSAEIIKVYNDILANYYGDVDKETLTDSAIKGMVYSLNDPYAMFLDSRNAIEFDEDLSGTFTGFGVEIRTNENNQIEIVTIFEGSPAEKAGLQVGDIITKMDSKEYPGDTMTNLIYEIKSSKIGTVKKIEILRNGEAIEKSITLDKIEVSSVYASKVEKNGKNVGIFQITNFAENTYDQFLKEYKKLEKEGIDSIVIDLRQNGGGYLSSANSLLSLFLDKDMVAYQRTDGVNTEEVVNDFEKKINKPVVLLVDCGTASSSEVFVSSMIDNLNVKVVGQKTYGKGTIQKLITLLNGRYIKFTVQEWLTPKGNKIEGVGITPTYEVSCDETCGSDNQLDKAIEIAAGL